MITGITRLVGVADPLYLIAHSMMISPRFLPLRSYKLAIGASGATNSLRELGIH